MLTERTRQFLIITITLWVLGYISYLTVYAIDGKFVVPPLIANALIAGVGTLINIALTYLVAKSSLQNNNKLDRLDNSIRNGGGDSIAHKSKDRVAELLPEIVAAVKAELLPYIDRTRDDEPPLEQG